jgi:hypothetical protein
LVKHFHLSPTDAWNCTLREYINLIDCEKNEPDGKDFEGVDMSVDALEEFVAIHEENRAKKAAKEAKS